MEERWVGLQKDFMAYRGGDPVRVRPLFESLSESLRGFFFLRTQNRIEAEDLTQVCLMKIHFARERFNPELSLKTWVFTIAGRVLIDHWRSFKMTEARTAPEDISELDETSHPSWDGAELVELRQDLQNALKELKPNDQTLVYLYVIEGLTMAEVAQVLGLTETATKVRAHRSYEKLKVILEKKEGIRS